MPAPYSATLWDHFNAPRNAGAMDSPDAVGRASVNGRAPYVTIYLKVVGERVAKVRFQTFGCGYSIAACWALTTYTYDAANQFQTSRDASGVTTYSFDANGNQQIVEAPGGGRTTYTWDYENQTTLIQLPTGARVTMAYNADNRRVRKVT
jgi:YD repeat-containing protein